MVSDFRNRPVDEVSAEKLAGSHFRLGLVDTNNHTAFHAWLQAYARGFHGDEPDAEQLTEKVLGLADRRTTGVWDEGAGDAAQPVGTVSSWLTELSLPGARPIDAWAVTSVTVSPACRRRGIARALLEAELATAAKEGVALSILTVSESTIYGRFGFAPAAFTTNLVIDPRRARWAGPSPQGSIRFVSLTEARELLPELHDQARASTPGQIKAWDLHWDEMTALAGDDRNRAKKLRAVRFDDPSGLPQGLALYRVTGGDDGFVRHLLDVEFLLSTTDEAYAALWRFVLSVDLVGEVRAKLRSVAEPLRWQIADQRGITETIEDHLWVRILDAPAVLCARGYASDGRIGFEVSDPYGYAQGRFLLDVRDGTGTVEEVEEAFPEGTPELAMTVNELSAVLLGGVSVTVLAASGRISELTPDAAVAMDTIFCSPVAPWLNVWF